MHAIFRFVSATNQYPREKTLGETANAAEDLFMVRSLVYMSGTLAYIERNTAAAIGAILGARRGNSTPTFGTGGYRNK